MAEELVAGDSLVEVLQHIWEQDTDEEEYISVQDSENWRNLHVRSLDLDSHARSVAKASVPAEREILYCHDGYPRDESPAVCS